MRWLCVARWRGVHAAFERSPPIAKTALALAKYALAGLIVLPAATGAPGCDGSPNGVGSGTAAQRPPAAVEALPADVVVTPAVDTLTNLGASVTLGAVVVGSDGSVLSGVPVTWATLAPGVATVGLNSGRVTATGVGTATIRASAGAASGDASVVVVP